MTAPIRIYCDDPDYAGTWIDINGRWTLADQRQMLDVAGDEFWSFLRGKTVACNIQAADGSAITDPAQISEDGLGGCDVLIVGWLGSVLPLAVARRRTLGNASARLSLPTNGATMTPATMTAKAAAPN